MAKSKAKEKAEELELDSTDSDAEAEEAPKKSDVTFGVADLAKHLSEVTGKEITTRDLRAQIRRMAREETPRVNREVVAGNRTRYDWPKGLKDPEVQAIIKAVTGGEIEAGKKAQLDKLKADKAAKKAAKEADGSKAKGKGGKSKKAAESDDDE